MGYEKNNQEASRMTRVSTKVIEPLRSDIAAVGSELQVTLHDFLTRVDPKPLLSSAAHTLAESSRHVVDDTQDMIKNTATKAQDASSTGLGKAQDAVATGIGAVQHAASAGLVRAQGVFPGRKRHSSVALALGAIGIVIALGTFGLVLKRRQSNHWDAESSGYDVTESADPLATDS